MRTFYRMPKEDIKVEGMDEHKMLITVNLYKGQSYLTSEVDRHNQITVFTSHWVKLPIHLFSGEVPFTE